MAHPLKDNCAVVIHALGSSLQGSRQNSALEWVIDRYQVSTNKRSGITNDPNRADDPQYILRLIGQVITVSLETVEIVQALPSLGLPE